MIEYTPEPAPPAIVRPLDEIQTARRRSRSSRTEGRDEPERERRTSPTIYAIGAIVVLPNGDRCRIEMIDPATGTPYCTVIPNAEHHGQ